MVDLLHYNIGKITLPELDSCNVLTKSQLLNLTLGVLNYPVEIDWQAVKTKLHANGETAILGKGWVWEYIVPNNGKISNPAILEWVLDKYIQVGVLSAGHYVIQGD
jgi:hypothetical protein